MVNEKLRTQKDNLARLMATEDLTIVHKAIPTAYFDVKNRVLACPTFKDDISPFLYDLFMGHEVGHALNTPYEGLHSTISENRTLKGYLNVVEDVRIEKAIKNKYQGLRSSFFKAYADLIKRDFFGIKGRDLQELSLIDKINHITKCGSRVSITLTTEELAFLKMSQDCKTWEDVVECATAIYEWSKENETRDKTDEQITFQMPDSEELEEDDEEDMEEISWGDSDPSDEEGDDAPKADGTPEDEEDPDGDNTDSFGSPIDPDKEPKKEEDKEEEGEVLVTCKQGGNFTGRYDEPEGARESITEHFAHNNEDQFVDENACIRTTIPLRERFVKKGRVDKVLYDYKTVLKDWREYFEGAELEQRIKDEPRDKENHHKYAIARYRKEIENRKHYLVLAKHYKKYVQNKNKKIVAHMAKEFEMRQTAQRNAKAFTASSGELDMNKLAKYQIVDDIFKRVTYIPDGKNHGLNVLVDWSGSISREVSDLLEQSLILAEFCRKVQIPFRVYLFSDAIKKDGDYSSGEGKLVEILSNEQSSRQYNEMFGYLSSILVSRIHELITYTWRKNEEVLIKEYNRIFGQVQTWDRDAYYSDKDIHNTHMYPRNYRLGGTPLDECLTALRKFIPEFNHQYQIEKSILTVITDGYSHSSRFFDGGDEEREDETSQMKGEDDGGYRSRWRKKRFFLDPYINKSFLFEDSSGDYYNRNDFERTQNLLEWLSDTCNVTITGYFVFSKKNEFRQTAYQLLGDSAYHSIDEMWKDMKKAGHVVTVKGYNKLFLTSATNLAVSGDDELDDEYIGANKNRVMAAFKRNQKGKTTSRFLTNEFIKEIA